MRRCVVGTLSSSGNERVKNIIPVFVGLARRDNSFRLFFLSLLFIKNTMSCYIPKKGEAIQRTKDIQVSGGYLLEYLRDGTELLISSVVLPLFRFTFYI